MLLLLALASAEPPVWAQDLATGDCAATLAALPSPATPGERLAAGTCANRLGRDGDAWLAAVDGPLAPYARLERARAALGSADVDPGRGLALLDGLALPGPDDERARVEALVRVGRAGEAAPLLAALPNTPETAMLRVSVTAATGGDVGPALRAIWTDWPTSPEADRAAELLEAAGEKTPDPSTATGRARMLARAAKLVDLSQAPLALPLYDAAYAVAPPTSASERLAFADALFAAKAYARARDLYAELGAPTLSSRAAFRHALATARAGDYAAAAPLYAALVKRYPDAKEADEASWKPGYMDYDAGRLEPAIAGFDRYLAARPSGKYAPEARWLRAWSLYKLGRLPEARAAFAAITSGPFAPNAAYWLARATGDDAALAAVARRFPESGYAWHVANRLSTPTPARVVPPPPALSAAFLTAHPDVALARALVDAGFPAEARRRLGDVRPLATDDATAVALAFLLVDVEDYRGAQALACARVSRVPAAAAACTPRPYAGVVGRVAAGYGLDPLLPYAIMNAESGLDPSVTSPAGARGLMQLMPLLALPLAEGRVPGFTIDDLYRAGVNARLGTTELGQLQARFGGGRYRPALPLVIAGYNGGADAVQRWVDAAGPEVELDRWAEDVSFSETRAYVRRVLGYLMQYRKVYGG